MVIVRSNTVAANFAVPPKNPIHGFEFVFTPVDWPVVLFGGPLAQLLELLFKTMFGSALR